MSKLLDKELRPTLASYPMKLLQLLAEFKIGLTTFFLFFFNEKRANKGALIIFLAAQIKNAQKHYSLDCFLS